MRKRSRPPAAATAFSNSDVAWYYDTYQSGYSRFWSPTAVHYGFWYEDTKSLGEAVRNTDRLVVDLLGIGPDDVVLDAGCGVGGTSLYIAETTGARVYGLTLSSVQLEIAKSNAAKSPAAGRLTFAQEDYSATSFADETFTGVFGIESVCHANDKADFLREAYRVLRPGGRIVVVDGFLDRERLTSSEQRLYEKLIAGWVVPNLASRARFEDQLRGAGFTGIRFLDMRRYIGRSIERIYRFSWLLAPLNVLGGRLGLTRPNLSARYQKLFFDTQAAIYGVFFAEKPSLEKASHAP
jgi:cyclopropane fatty-acyl-phospholipid synthase-like methyltransferase